MRLITFIALLFFIKACAPTPIGSPSLKIYPIKTESQNSGEPNLFQSASGDLYLSWIENVNDTLSALQWSRLSEEKWEAPREIARGSNWFVNWADFPQIAVGGEQGEFMAAHWLQKSDLGTYDYDIKVSTSGDAGKTWAPSFVLHQDKTPAEHGFVSMTPTKEGRILATWLDGRNTKTEDKKGQRGAMTLRAAEFDTKGEIYEAVELDSRVCDCCQTDIAMTNQGPVVVYRDRSESEIRDISIVRKINDQWSKPQTIGNDNWEIAGCPVNGPAIAANGSHLAIAWFTIANDKPKVQVVFSEDGGNSFSPPIQIDEGTPHGRVDLVWIDEQSVLVSWLEQFDEQGEVRLAKVSDEGKIGNSFKATDMDLARKSGFPILKKLADNQYLLAWTEVGKQTVIKTQIMSWE